MIDKTVAATLRQLMVGQAPWPLFLHGPAGTGKTCIGLCLVDFAAHSRYGTLPDYLDRLGDSQRGRDGQTTRSFLDAIESLRLLVIDEVGTRCDVKDFHYEGLKRLLDRRDHRPLVAISNFDLDGLAKIYDDRIASRLAAGTVLHVGGPDRRIA